MKSFSGNINYTIALLDFESQRNRYISFLPFCENKTDQMKLINEIRVLSSKIDKILNSIAIHE